MNNESNKKTNRAILIGVSRFDDEAYLPIPAAANSLRNMQEVLTDPKLCSWPVSDVTVIANPTYDPKVVLQLRRLAQETTGTLLVYFVGHGTTTERGELCLVFSDTISEHADITGLLYSHVRDALLLSPARVKIAILDCCYSGRALQALSDQANALADATNVQGTYTLTAADGAAHVVPLIRQYSESTSFTRELTCQIREGIPGKSSILTLDDLWAPLRSRMIAQGLPAPNRRVDDTASEFPFTRNTAVAANLDRGSSASRVREGDRHDSNGREIGIRVGDWRSLKNAVSIDSIVSRYVELRDTGRELRGVCPLHEGSEESLTVNRKKGVYYCFGCAEGGDVAKFVMQMEHLSSSEAFEWVANRAGITLLANEPGSRVLTNKRHRLMEAHELAAAWYVQQLNSSSEASVGREFLAERGFDKDAAVQFAVGYSPQGWDHLIRYLRSKGFSDPELIASGLVQEGRRGLIDRFRGRLMWPMRDMVGNATGFCARRLRETDIGPKYLHTPETMIYKRNQTLYGLDLARKDIARTKRVAIVDGFTDVMACHLAGATAAVSTCGTIFGVDHIKTLRRILPDNGSARVVLTFGDNIVSRKAALRIAESDQKFAAETYIAVEPDGMGPCKLRLAKGNEAVVSLVEPRTPLFEYVIQQIARDYDLESSTGRAAALDQTALVVARIRNRGLQHELAIRLAETLHISDTTYVVRRVAQLARSTRERSAVDQPAKPPQTYGSMSESPSERVLNLQNPVFATERELLKLALQHPELVSPTFDAFGVDEFTAPPYAAVRQAITEAQGTEYGVQKPQEYLIQVQGAAANDEIRAMITELSLEPVMRRVVDAQYAGDILSHVRQRSVDRRIAKLSEILKSSEFDGDRDRAKAVQSELWKLHQYRMDLKERGAKAL